MPVVAAHVVAAAVVAAGVLAQVFRAVAPDIGPVADAARWFDPVHLEQVAAYRGPRYAVAIAATALRLGIPLALALTPAGRRLTTALIQRVGEHRPALAAGVVVVAVLLLIDVVLLPLAFWSGFVHEGAFGFRTQGLAGWAGDWVLGRAPTWVGAAVLVPLAYALVRRFPRAWPPILGLSGAAVVAAVVAAGPVVLEPLQHRTEPLPPGPLRTEVERVVERSGTPVSEIVVADASRRTTKQNAYVSGLGGTRRIVLYDNLVMNQTPAEVGVVLAHELGHHRNGDLPRGVLAGGAAIVLLAYLLAAVAGVLTRRGVLRGAADPRGAVYALAVVVVLSFVTQPVEMWMSRRAEAAADYVALEITADPDTYRASKLALARSNLSDPDPPRWAYLLWASHPSTRERLTMGERWPVGG